MIENIKIQYLLPLVFVGMEDSEKIGSSQIWEEPSYVFRRGCRLCVQSESGGGKSSLLSFVYGLRTDYKGEILFDGTDIRTFGIDRWCRLRTEALSLLPQEMCLFPELTVSQNIALKNNRTRHKTEAQIREMLERVGLSGKYDTPAGKLSIGQQQRVAVIRALCQPFDFIFMDEPVSHLDARNNRIIAEMVEEEAASRQAGVISTSVGNPLLLDNAQFIHL